MIRLTLAQMRMSVGRLIPAGLAIVLGTAFVAFTLIAGNVMTRSAYDQVTAQFGSADLVVTPDENTLDSGTLAQIRATTDVRSADGLMMSWVQLDGGARSSSQMILPVPSDPDLSPLDISEGHAPTADDEIALPEATATRLEVSVGDPVTVTWWPEGADQSQTATVTLVGLVDDPNGAWNMWGGAGLAVTDAVTTWSGARTPTYDSILVATDDPSATRTDLKASLDGVLVRTRDAVAAEQVASVTSGSNQLVLVVLAFAAIALLVAALVIANTFQVLVAQRTRTLALLRCVGARRAQLRTAVLLEGLLLGLVASVAGVLVGVAVSQAGLWVLGNLSMGVPIPGTVPITVWSVVVPLIVGTAVTVAASLVPARVAGRTSPVAALRPIDGPSVRETSGRVRLAFAGLLTFGGAALLLFATISAVRAQDYDGAEVWLGLGVLGGAISFLGILVGAVFWTPRVVSGAGAVAGLLGPASRLAAANTLRNPRRTAATSTALLIGVTLVVTMSTGAATARRSLDVLLDEQYPVDLTAVGVGPDSADGSPRPGALDSSVLPAISAVEGVSHAVPVRGTEVKLGAKTMYAYGMSAQQAREALHDPALAEALTAGQIVVPETVSAGEDVTLSSGKESVTVSTVAGWADSTSLLVPLSVMDTLSATAPVVAVWADLTDDANPTTVLSDTQDAIGEQPVMISSSAAERAQFEQVINILLAVVVGLLAVAVIIALIGVANTLSLSVLERRRESATLRSVGMTRRQLRGSLAMEGVLVALVGSATGIVLGMLYGWAGSTIVFGPAVGTVLAVPWADLAAVVVIAVAAGLLASVVPARSAARTPPVAALAVE